MCQTLHPFSSHTYIVHSKHIDPNQIYVFKRNSCNIYPRWRWLYVRCLWCAAFYETVLHDGCLPICLPAWLPTSSTTFFFHHFNFINSPFFTFSRHIQQIHPSIRHIHIYFSNFHLNALWGECWYVKWILNKAKKTKTVVEMKLKWKKIYLFISIVWRRERYDLHIIIILVFIKRIERFIIIIWILGFFHST